jgi:predicted ArsR family transcriptional regulator
MPNIKAPDDLFDPGLAARRDDVDTSHAAAGSMIDTARQHHLLILDVMRIGGLWSAQEIADATSIDYVAVGKRMCELRRKRFVYRTDEKHRNRSGRAAYKYTLTETKETTDA